MRRTTGGFTLSTVTVSLAVSVLCCYTTVSLAVSVLNAAGAGDGIEWQVGCRFALWAASAILIGLWLSESCCLWAAVGYCYTTISMVTVTAPLAIVLSQGLQPYPCYDIFTNIPVQVGCNGTPASHADAPVEEELLIRAHQGQERRLCCTRILVRTLASAAIHHKG